MLKNFLYQVRIKVEETENSVSFCTCLNSASMFLGSDLNMKYNCANPHRAVQDNSLGKLKCLG